MIFGEAGHRSSRSADWGKTWAPQPSPYKGSLFGALVAADGAVVAFGMRGTHLPLRRQGQDVAAGRQRVERDAHRRREACPTARSCSRAPRAPRSSRATTANRSSPSTRTARAPSPSPSRAARRPSCCSVKAAREKCLLGAQANEPRRGSSRPSPRSSSTTARSWLVVFGVAHAALRRLGLAPRRRRGLQQDGAARASVHEGVPRVREGLRRRQPRGDRAHEGGRRHLRQGVHGEAEGRSRTTCSC